MSEKSSSVSSGVPADDTNELAEEFAPSGLTMEEREPQLQRQFEKLSARENYYDFAEEYFRMEKEIASLKAKYEEQQKEIRSLKTHCKRLSSLNVSQSLKVDHLEKMLQGRGEECEEDDKDGNGATQYNENSKQVRILRN